MPVFPKSARITKSREFDFLLKEGKRRHGRHLGLCWQKAPERRLGVVISRKIRGAAKKNRIKRVVREFFRLQRELFPQGEVIVIAKMGTDALTNSQLRGALYDLLAD
ncbi:MAG: ribonuclease P protein component [Deltaproteobacteria bacterium]|nr:ribonuclease P protein component [Deltaproteobacteria bacterium]